MQLKIKLQISKTSDDYILTRIHTLLLVWTLATPLKLQKFGKHTFTSIYVYPFTVTDSVLIVSQSGT